MKFCPDCGKPCDGAKFCPDCGFDLRPYLPVVHRMVPPEAPKSPTVTVTVPAQTIPDNIETLLAPFGWALNDDGKTYTITGVKDENIQSADIPYGVTIIGEGAFNYCQSLTSITIPDSVTSIGEYAFEGCKSLTNITLPKHTKVAENAFPATCRVIRA